jgi:hypothetical protein
VEQSDELKSALVLIPEKRYTGNCLLHSILKPRRRVLIRCRFSRHMAKRRKPSILCSFPLRILDSIRTLVRHSTQPADAGVDVSPPTCLRMLSSFFHRE